MICEKNDECRDTRTEPSKTLEVRCSLIVKAPSYPYLHFNGARQRVTSYLSYQALSLCPSRLILEGEQGLGGNAVEIRKQQEKARLAARTAERQQQLKLEILLDKARQRKVHEDGTGMHAAGFSCKKATTHDLSFIKITNYLCSQYLYSFAALA